MEKIVVTLWITFGIYLMVLLAIMADLWSGVRKAKKNGIARSSYGFKRTVDKIARYYNVLLALTVVDAMLSRNGQVLTAAHADGYLPEDEIE